MQTDITLEEAQELLLSHVFPLPEKLVPLLDSPGYVCHQDIYATHDLPAYPQAAMDGYAVATADQSTDSSYYALQGRLWPGEMPGLHLQPGQAVGVLTGGPIPAGTEAVIPQEAAVLSENKVSFTRKIKPGSNIKLPGEDFRTGDLIARRGTVLGPGLLGVLAAYGKSELAVFTRPKVAVLSLGKQIVPFQAVHEPGRVRDCNGPLLATFIKSDGAEVVGVEVAGDENSSQVKCRLENMLQQADVVLTIGGAASGACDETLYLLKYAGLQPMFWGVKIKPGSHSGAAVYNSKLIISLSGNPAACAVGYHLLVSPVLRGLQGLDSRPLRLSVRCTNSFLKKGGPRRFVRGHASCGQKGWQVTILPGQKSSMLRSLLDCNVLIDLPGGHPPVEEGNEVSVIFLT